METSAKVKLEPSGISVDLPLGKPVFEALREKGILLEGPCGGLGLCKKCCITIIDTENNKQEALACQTKVNGPMKVFLPRCCDTSPVLEKVDDDLEEPAKTFRISPLNLSKKESLYDEILKTYPALPVTLFTDFLMNQDKDETCFIVSYVKKPLFVANTPPSRIYGVALDIGTTNLAASLIDMNNCKEKSRGTLLSPLVFYGHDVLSRVAYVSMYPSSLSNMRMELTKGIMRLIETLCDHEGIDSQDVYIMVVAGNPVMTHLFLGLDPRSIGVAPYTPFTLRGVELHAGESGIPISPKGLVLTLPGISSFVGGDIVSGLISLEIKRYREPFLFIDVGTNGEMVVGNNGKFWACSAAAGPAFEGRNICCGMRAESGAINGVHIHDGKIVTNVIGEGKAKGICGSGLIDLVAEFLRVGFIDSSGRIVQPKGKAKDDLASYWREESHERYILLGKDSDCVFISQKDIRQIQLAKGAIRTAIEIILEASGLSAEEIKVVYLAGAFGSHLSPVNLARIGLIPYSLVEKVESLGNTSLAGARNLLTGRSKWSDAIGVVSKTEDISLVSHPQFQEIFIKSLDFPVTG